MSEGRNADKIPKRKSYYHAQAAGVKADSNRFAGDCNAMQGHIFDCTTKKDIHVFKDTIKFMADFVGTTFENGSEIRCIVENLVDFSRPKLMPLASDASELDKKLYKKRCESYVRKEDIYEEGKRKL